LQNEPVPVLSLSDLIASKEAADDPNPRKRSADSYLRALQMKISDDVL
jgi:hypothetical protein